MNALEIKDFRKRNGLTQESLSEIVESSINTVRSWEQGQRNIPSSAVKLMQIFESNTKHDLSVQEPKENYNKPKSEGVPYYDVDFAGGWSSEKMFSNSKPDFFINNPEFDRCDFACNLIGKSVSKVIPDGSIVGFRIIEDWKTFFSINELYGIITKNDFRTVKRITKSKDGKNLILKPEPSERYKEIYNDEFETIPIDYVTRFLQVMAYATFEKISM